MHCLSKQEVEELLRHACHEGSVFVVHTLVKNGYTVNILSTEEQEELLHCTCSEDDVFVAHTLFEKGFSASILSTEEQEQLLHLAWRKSDVFLVHTLLEDGCRVGAVLIVEALLDSGCSMNCAYSNGVTLLMIAIEKGHEKVVRKLILAGANLRMQTTSGESALHFAAISSNIQGGILLVEGGASVRTKNNLAQTPLDLAKGSFQEAIKQALSFTMRKTLCIIGNAEGGKSTLIAALQTEKNSGFGKIVNHFKRVSDHCQPTAGIKTVSHYAARGMEKCSSLTLQANISTTAPPSVPGVSPQQTRSANDPPAGGEDDRRGRCHLAPAPSLAVALMATPISPPHVIIIGSFLDKVKSKEEATAKLTRCMEATKRELDGLPLELVGSSFLNCCQPQSKGIDQLCKFL